MTDILVRAKTSTIVGNALVNNCENWKWKPVEKHQHPQRNLSRQTWQTFSTTKRKSNQIAKRNQPKEAMMAPTLTTLQLAQPYDPRTMPRRKRLAILPTFAFRWCSSASWSTKIFSRLTINVSARFFQNLTTTTIRQMVVSNFSSRETPRMTSASTPSRLYVKKPNQTNLLRMRNWPSISTLWASCQLMLVTTWQFWSMKTEVTS